MDPVAIAAADQAAEDPQDPGVPVAGPPQDVPTIIPPAQSATAFDETGDPLEDELSAQADALQISALSASPFQRTVVVHRGNGLSATGGYPSDSTGAVGTRYYVEMVNSRIVVYRRADLARVAGPLSFQAFTRVNPADRMGDPQIQWDPVAHRWFYVIARFPPPGGGANTLEYGWSKTSSPRPLTTGWCNKRYTTKGPPGIYDDFPKLGHSDTSLLIGTLRITPNVKPVIYAPHIFVISKPPAGAAGNDCAHVNLRVSVMGGLTPTGFGAPVPINPVGHAPGLLVAAQRGGGAELAMWRVKFGPKRPYLVSSTIPVAPYAVPPKVPQPNAIDPRTKKRLFIDSRGAELVQAVAARDPLVGCPIGGCPPGSRPPGALAIWTQQTVALQAQGHLFSQVAWYELLPDTPGGPRVRQAGDVSTPNRFLFNGAISPTTNGLGATIQYNAASGGTHGLLVRIRARSRGPMTGQGKMVGEVELAHSATADRDLSCYSHEADPRFPADVCRWGDYAGASPDPRLAALTWGTNMLEGPMLRDASGKALMCTQPPPAPPRQHPCPAWQTRNFALLPTS